MTRPAFRTWLIAASVLWLLGILLAVPRTTQGKQVKKEKKAANQDIFANASDKIVRGQLSDLQFYQLAIPSPQPPAGSFDQAAAARGDGLFSGKAKCNNCQVEPLWTDPGWNLHQPSEVCIDSFQADRAPDLYLLGLTFRESN